jgi:replicative DNA helicase
MAKEFESKDYNEAKQKLLIDILLSSEDVFSRCQNILSDKYFVNKFRPAVRFLLKYADEYRVLPKVEQINAESGIEFNLIENITIQHVDSFLDEIEEFCKNRALADAVLSAVELIDKGNYGEVEKRVKEAILISLQSDLGTNYFADPRSRLEKIKTRNGQISSGWKALDAKLYGGLNRGEISIFCGASGAGKSLVLQNISANLIQQGLNVVYLTLELSEELTAMRIDSMLSSIATTDIFRKLDEVEIKIKQIGYKSGNLHIKQMPQGSRCNDLKVYLKNYEIETGNRPDVLVVDYLDLIFPNNKRIDTSDLFITGKFVTEELRGLAVERNLVCVTASQLNRCLSLDTKIAINGVEKEIRYVKTGDFISSNEGPVMVEEVLPITMQNSYKIKTKSGKEIICSANHMFPTKEGLKTINTGLKIGDSLRSINLGKLPLDLFCNREMSNVFEIDDEIVEIKYMGKQNTIDINVTGNRLFYANGILTHNSAVNEQEHDHSMIAGGISKIQTADNVISIFASTAMKERGEYQFQFLKTRSSSGVGSKISLGFDGSTLRMFDLDDNGEAMLPNTAENVFDSIRRKNSSAKETTAKPVAATVTPSTGIRDLSSLKSLINR